MTAVGAVLPLLGIEIAGDDASRIVALVVLSAIAVMDVVLARFITLPSMRGKGATRKVAESSAYAFIETTGVLAVLTGIATDSPVAPFVPGMIGLYGWMAVRRYLADWPEGALDRSTE